MTETSVRRRNLRRTLGTYGMTLVFVTTSVMGALANPEAARAALPDVSPIPPQIVNGGYATVPGLPANTTRFDVVWSDPDPGQTFDVELTWGDGNVDLFELVTSPYTVEHTYASAGLYSVRARVIDSSGSARSEFASVVVADLSSGADTKLYSSNLQNSERFGQAVHLADGVAVVGEPNFSTSRGRVHVYTTPDDGDHWQLHQTLATTPTVSGINFGTAIDRDGSIMAVGARAAFRPDGVRTGAVYIFEQGVDGTWSQTQILYPGIGDEFGDFGFALALDDGRLAVGAPRRNLAGDRRGVVHLFERGADGLWAETGEVTSPSQANLDFFGTAVDLLGTDLAVGAPGGSFNPSNLNGKVFVYPWPIDGPPAPPAFVHGGAVNGTNGQSLGASIALSGGDTLVVGAPSALDASLGRVHVMHYGAGDLVISDTLPPQNEFALGQTVAIDGDLIASHSNGPNTRPVTLFTLTGSGWVRAGVLTPDPGSSAVLNNASNRRVAIADGLILSGQDNDSDLGTDHGAALIWQVPDFVPPPPPSVAVDPDPVDIAQEAVVTATATDEATGGSAISTVEYQLDAGDWLPMDPVDGAFDAVTETAEIAVNFATVGTHEVCARATDAAGNVGDPGCTEVQVELGETVPIAVTITTLDLNGVALDDGLAFAELYAKVSLFLPHLDLELSNRDDAVLTTIGSRQPAYWTFGEEVPANLDQLALAIGIFDRDPSGPLDDDQADINPAVGLEGLELTVTMADGTWPEGPLAQMCSEGEGGAESTSVRVCVAVSVLSSSGDLDGDALLDPWEQYGYDDDGDGIADLDLLAWGADPERKDLFVEVDCLADAAHSHCPFEDSVELIARTFADGDVDNVDGTSGVQLHLDVGTLFGAGRIVEVMGADGAISTYGDLGGGNGIPEAGNEVIVFEPTGDYVDTEDGQAILTADPPFTRIGDLKELNFETLRLPVFRYSLWGHGTAFRKFDGTDCTSGLAERVGAGDGRIADDHLVTLGEHRADGSPCRGTNAAGISVGTVAEQAGTFIHEFAHNLGLAHGGTDEVNRKPNHRSVLNYANMQFCNVTVSAGGPTSCDLSREALPTLDENSFDECLGYDSGGPLGPVNVDGSAEASGGSGEETVVLPTFQGESCGNGTSNIMFDLNDDGSHTLLNGSDDWAAISYGYRDRPEVYGDSVFGGGPTPELLAEAQAYLDAMSAPSLLLSASASVEVVEGQELTIDTGLDNVGNGPALAVSVEAVAPDGTPLGGATDIVKALEGATVDLRWLASADDVGSHEIDVVVRYLSLAGTPFEEHAVVAVTVLPAVEPNDPPVAADDAYVTAEDAPLLVPAPGVLANDVDPDGDPLTAILETGPANGSLALEPDGSFTYTPDPDYHGPDGFAYAASDGPAGDIATVAITVSPVNDPPVADAGPDQSVSVGDLVTLDGSGSADVDLDPLTYGWQITSAPAGSTAVLTDAATTSPSFTPDVAGAYSIELTVDDGLANDTDTVTVSVAPAPGGDAEGPITSLVELTQNPAPINTDVSIVALVDDAASGGSTIAGAEYSIDGSPFVSLGAADAAFDEVSESVTGTIPAGTFPSPAVHEVCVRGSDTAGNTGATSCVPVAIYDPNAGFVTGGGWIDSPAGAYTPDPAVDGRANFAFVSAYRKGRTVPEGTTQFTFSTGDLRFQSTSYEYLIVNRGDSQAQFKGRGTINGEGDYRFTIWATDGGPGGTGDTFRIRIWEELGGVETVIYDNWTAQPLSGGSVTVHRGR